MQSGLFPFAYNLGIELTSCFTPSGFSCEVFGLVSPGLQTIPKNSPPNFTPKIARKIQIFESTNVSRRVSADRGDQHMATPFVVFRPCREYFCKRGWGGCCLAPPFLGSRTSHVLVLHDLMTSDYS